MLVAFLGFLNVWTLADWGQGINADGALKQFFKMQCFLKNGFYLDWQKLGAIKSEKKPVSW